MTSAFRRNALTVVLAFLAALGGTVLGSRLSTARAHHGTELHALLHRGLVLDTGQDTALDGLEARFAVQRAGFEAQLRADNARLATAIAHEHRNGPQVVAAVDRSHQTMGALQKATLAHVFAMRMLMRPDQTAAFDHIVVQALTAGS